MVRLRFFIRDKHNHCGVCGGDDISGYGRRGFGERVVVCVCVRAHTLRGGCKDTEFKDANHKKVQTLK